MSKTDYLKSDAYLSANDLVDSLILREGGDTSKKPLYTVLLKEVYTDLNLSVIRQTERAIYPVGTGLKEVILPDHTMQVSSVAVKDRHTGKYIPCYVNTQLAGDIADLGASKKCGCEDCDCDCANCSNVRNYETISSQSSEQMPDGSTKVFTATFRKKLLLDGSLVMETRTLVRQFENNVHVRTELVSKTETICKLDIKACGCIKDTERNKQLLNDTSDAYTVEFDCGCPVFRIRQEELNTYKVSDSGNRLVFPPHFPYDHVLVRTYVMQKTKEIRIPFLAAKPVRLGIKLEEAIFNSSEREIAKWQRLYNMAKSDLMRNINKIKLKEVLNVVLAKFDVL